MLFGWSIGYSASTLFLPFEKKKGNPELLGGFRGVLSKGRLEMIEPDVGISCARLADAAGVCGYSLDC